MNWNQYCATFFSAVRHIYSFILNRQRNHNGKLYSHSAIWSKAWSMLLHIDIKRELVVDEPTIRSTALNFKNDLFSYKQMNMPSLVFLNYIHFYTSIRFVVNHIYQFVNHEQIVLTTLHTPYVRIKRKRCTRRGWEWPPPHFFQTRFIWNSYYWLCIMRALHIVNIVYICMHYWWA